MKIYSMLGAILVVAIGGGCISSAPLTVEKMGPAYKTTVGSLLLNNYIRVTERSTRIVNGMLEAQVRGQNVKDKDVQFEYRYIWLDRDGIRIDTQMSTWKPLALHAKEVALMNGVAPTPEATAFLMSVRFAHQTKRW